MKGNQKAEYDVSQLDSINFVEVDSSGDNPNTDPSVTGDAIDITNKSATLVGYATSIRESLANDLRVGFIYCLEGTPNKNNGTQVTVNKNDVAEDGRYTATIENLLSDATYYFRSFVYQSGLWFYGKVKSFVTAGYDINFSTGEATDITCFSAKVSGGVDVQSSYSSLTYGICYGTNIEPTTSDNTQTAFSNNFTMQLRQLTGGTTYYYRPYTIVDGQTYYGTVRTFRTLDDNVVETGTIDEETLTVTSHLTIGGGAYSSLVLGVCYGMTETPTINNSIVTSDEVNEYNNYTVQLVNLDYGIIYYRAYVLIDGIPHYGVVKSYVNDGTMKFAKFYGVVTRKMYNDWGDPAACEGVKVTSGDQTTTTSANGYYQLESVKVVNGRAILKFEKKGFMTVVRSVPMQEGMHMDVTMVQTDAQEGFEATNGEVLHLNSFDHMSTMEIELPANGFVKEDGTAYTGIVWPTYVYLDPDDATFATQMPSDLSAIREDQTAAQLISYGMFALELRSSSNGNGEKINLAPGQTAFVKFPVPDKFKGETLPPTMPLWSFNEETGLWEEEGVALLDGEWYYGEVSHFSWHNLDSPEITATIKVTVKDSNGKPLVGVPVDIGGQRQYFTDQNGKLKCDIPSNCDVYVRVPSEYYGNYAQGDPTKEAKTTVNLNGEETREITLTVAAACSVITGKVTNTGAGSNVCTLALSYFKEGWGWMQTGSVISDINGQFILYGPAGDTGAAMLTASFNDGTSFTHNFELTGGDQVVNFSVNSTSSIGAGVVTVKNESLGIKATYFLPAPKNGGYWEAASINGSIFSAGFTTQDKEEIDWNSGETVDMVNFDVRDYASGKTHFEMGSFFWMKEGGPHLRIEVQNSPADITKNGDVYTFKMTEVDGTLEDQMRNYNYVNVKVSVKMSVKEANN